MQCLNTGFQAYHYGTLRKNASSCAIVDFMQYALPVIPFNTHPQRR